MIDYGFFYNNKISEQIDGVGMGGSLDGVGMGGSLGPMLANVIITEMIKLDL